ncbi:hypothetical protein GCM10010254_58760 [Streptomyces chromofuscus]|nr:hypothetical protein GCM10010254_58760 [Streptomyces chromofuscus]
MACGVAVVTTVSVTLEYLGYLVCPWACMGAILPKAPATVITPEVCVNVLMTPPATLGRRSTESRSAETRFAHRSQSVHLFVVLVS